MTLINRSCSPPTTRMREPAAYASGLFTMNQPNVMSLRNLFVPPGPLTTSVSILPRVLFIMRAWMQAGSQMTCLVIRS